MTAYPGIWSEQEYQKDFHPSIYKKADHSQFATWCQDQPVATQNLFTPFEGDSRWGKVSRTFYKEVYFNNKDKVVPQEDPEGSKRVTTTHQRYTICLDPNSRFSGNFYHNDAKIELYIKFLASAIFRPVHTVFYTLYNATLIHAAVIIFEGIKEEKPANEILQKVVCSLADIVRTPVYEVAILIVTVAGLLLAPFHPELMYDLRAVVGRLNRELGWGKREGLHDFMPCMQPLGNVMEFTLNDQLIQQNKWYEDVTNPVLVALDNRRG